jgi:CTP synthase
MGMRRKVAQFCNVAPEAVIQSLDAPTIYQVPLMMHEQGLDEFVIKKMGVECHQEPNLEAWNNFLAKLSSATKEVKIGLVGKYVELQDAYKSISESLSHAATYNDHKLKLVYIHSEKLTDKDVEEKLSDMDGVIIAPGFGQRGIEGKFVAIKWCRENDIPTFGICLGMQCIVIEYARNVLGLADANSTEMDTATKNNVIDLMEEQKGIRIQIADFAYDSLKEAALFDLSNGGRGVGNQVEALLINPLSRWLFDNAVIANADVTIEHFDVGAKPPCVRCKKEENGHD